MPRKNNPKETVERVITAAMKLFNEKGFDKTSMQDIVAESDMSKGAIFYHFSSKEEIFEAAMERQFEYVMAQLKVWLAEMEGLCGREKLIGLLMRNIFDEKLTAASMAFSAIENISPHLILTNMQHNLAYSAQIVANIIREGIADGSISTDYPDESAELLLHLLNYWCDPIIFKCDLPTVRRRLECLQYVMKSLGVDIITKKMIDGIMDLTEKLYGGLGNEPAN